eukprot:6156832-Lingulodinium_polyedra.AAC.1
MDGAGSGGEWPALPLTARPFRAQAGSCWPQSWPVLCSAVEFLPRQPPAFGPADAADVGAPEAEA